MHENLVRRILAEHGQLAVAVDALAGGDDLYGAGLTSHATVNVMLALEDELGFEFPEHLVRRATFESVSALTAAVEEAQTSGN